MTVTANAKPVVISDKKAAEAAPLARFQFTGRNALVRNAALEGVASLAYNEGKSRTDVITQLRLALGKAPKPAEVKAAALEYVIGRVAQKLPFGKRTVAEQMTFARQLVTQYAAPAQDGVTAADLRKHQIGRRNPEQHKIVRAAEGAWYLINAELGFGNSQTQAEKNKRQAAAPGSTKRGKASQNVTPPTHGELVKSTATPPKDASETCAMVMQLAASLLAYSQKHAALMPAAYGQSIVRFHGAIAELEKTRKAKPADAIA